MYRNDFLLSHETTLRLVDFRISSFSSINFARSYSDLALNSSDFESFMFASTRFFSKIRTCSLRHQTSSVADGGYVCVLREHDSLRSRTPLALVAASSVRCTTATRVLSFRETSRARGRLVDVGGSVKLFTPDAPNLTGICLFLVERLRFSASVIDAKTSGGD